MKRIISGIIGLMLTLTVWAQKDYQQRQLTMDSGLTSNTINVVAKDNRGFIWLGTANGLCRYDGVLVASYHVTENESFSSVNAILPNNDGSMFVGTSHGVYLFSFDTETFQSLLDDDKEADVTSMVKDQQNTLWIATRHQGIWSYTGPDEELKHYTLPEAAEIHRLYLDNNGQLWALTRSDSLSVWQLDCSTDRFVPFQMLREHPFVVTTMLDASEGRLWLGTLNDGLMCLYPNGQMEGMSMTHSGHALHVNAIFQYSSTHLLVGCDDGLWLFDTTLQTFQLYLAQRFVTTIGRDHEGGLWIGTHFNGVNYISPIAHRFDSYPVGSTNKLCEDRQGRIWTARESGGLVCHPKGHPEQTISNFAGHALLDKLQVHNLCMDGDDLWIGTVSDGVYVYSTTTGRLRHYVSSESANSLYDPNSCALLRDRKGDIWVSTMEGLCLYQRRTDDFKRVSAEKSMPVSMKADAKGRIWISTQGDGLWMFDSKAKKGRNFFHVKDDPTTISHNNVNCVFIDGKERIWVGTQGGLCLFHETEQNFERIIMNLPRAGISSITEQQGVLWMASDCGVLRYDANQSLQRFTQHDGLSSEQFHPDAVLAASDGRIYFGNSNGFNAFYPKLIKVNEQMAPVFITRLEINNQPQQVGNWHLPTALSDIEQLDLWYNDAVVSFSFASLSYCSPEKNMYAYKLEGFDHEWNYVEHEHKATYTNLDPGHYTFLVRATNNDGIWSDQTASLRIEVHPPFWWNIYAKILYVLLFIILITLFIRFRLYITERRHRKEIARLNLAKEEEMRVERTEFFTTIAHEIRTPVSLIIGPLDTLKDSLKSGHVGDGDFKTLDVIERNAHRLLDLVNQLLDFRKVEQNKMDMNFAPQDICELMSGIVSNFEGVFTATGCQLVTHCPEEHFTAVVDREALTKILNNLLSNANKYTKDTITIGCKLLKEQKMFRIEVTDNGNGISKNDQLRIFDPFYQTKKRKPGTGIGLSIVKKLVEQHHGTISVKSELGKGTTFLVELPMSQEYSGEQAPVEQVAEVQPTQENSTPEQSQQPTVKPHMLIVEDNEDMLTFLVTSFMDHFEVVPAHDGTEAVEILKESLVVRNGQPPRTTFDIVISDWMMDQMDGPELCSRMRQNAATKHVPFILLTAKTDSQSKVQAMEVGVDAFIEKPFAVKYLEACVQNLLTRKER